jgi:hypothetical protein
MVVVVLPEHYLTVAELPPLRYHLGRAQARATRVAKHMHDDSGKLAIRTFPPAGHLWLLAGRVTLSALRACRVVRVFWCLGSAWPCRVGRPRASQAGASQAAAPVQPGRSRPRSVVDRALWPLLARWPGWK